MAALTCGVCRNHIPWIIIGICYVVCPVLLLILRFLLAAENKRRDREPPDTTYDDVYIEVVQSDGKVVQKKLDKVRVSKSHPEPGLMYELVM